MEDGLGGAEFRRRSVNEVKDLGVVGFSRSRV